ncbi:CPBP family intramembrane glutamic endopeptidase [Plebeiibacterium sediminum]|uniref:CPBP family intramembrane metalloprotease n=1 Tax=Plebeiibacterium sediminum TaxID=2992112 RepID=A0AAE3SF41_9BACT|nr:type II CAAX endopeptidase family protein [Plebeiobacterium sediminum]MCW3787138.1 CPBP family intramembrane metalloprotease [Plebeiobacterium sediminum]
MAKYFIAIKEKLIAFWGKEEIELNFWRALILILCVLVVYILGFVIAGYFFKSYLRSKAFIIISDYSYSLLYVSAIVFCAKKTNIHLKDSLFIPDLSSILKMVVIILLAITIVYTPIVEIGNFFESLMNGKLRIAGTTLRPLFPWRDLRLVIIGPIIEEFFFRGIVLKNFQRKYSPVYSIILSSLLFAAYHYSIDKFIFLTFLGILFAIIYYKTNSLVLVSLGHMFWNALTFFQYEYLELDATNWIGHLVIYIAATVWLVYLLRKDWELVKIDWLLKSADDSQ